MFKGLYYDHKVAEATLVGVEVFPESLLLQYAREGEMSERLIWRFSNISVRVKDRSFIRITHTCERQGTLDVNDRLFVETFLESYRHTHGANVHRQKLNSGVWVGLMALLFIIGILLAGYFFLLPWCADRMADQLPHSFDKRIGEAALVSMHEKTDTAGSELLTKFAAQLKWDSPDSLVFKIVQGDTENAYALPGGYIMVYTGLLRKLQTKEELAALLSHEVAHVTRRHSVRKLCRDMSTSLLLSVLISDAGGLAGALYSNADAIYSLSYSRRYEQDADITGLETMRRNQVDQRGMVQLMEQLGKLNRQLKAPEFTSTHPLTDKRIRYVEKEIKAHPAAVVKHEQMEEIFRVLRERYHD